jgi:hypothetical protein
MKDNTVRNCLIWGAVILVGLYLLSAPESVWVIQPKAATQARP